MSTLELPAVRVRILGATGGLPFLRAFAPSRETISRETILFALRREGAKKAVS